MKYLTLFIVLAAIAFACAPPPSENGDEIPADLEGKKAYLKVKRDELKQLTALVSRLEDEIDQLDPERIAKKARLVTVQPLKRKNFKKYVEVQGAVEADDLVDVTSESAGRIATLTVEEGDFVKKGQLIAKLDLEQINKQIAEVNKALELAQTVFERQERLWNQNIGSEIQYLEAKNNKERLEKNLETLEFQLTKGEVFAPISGVVDRVVLQSGEIATPGMPIIEILNTNRLKVVADVPENLLRSVKRGERVVIRFPALNIERTARVSLIGRTIDSANRTFKIEAAIDGNIGLLKQNLLATVMINDFTAPDVITVPVESVLQEISGKDYVFVKGSGEEGPVAKKVFVETGESYQGEIVVTQGLSGGEELIVTGARDLSENEPIKVHNS